MSRALALCVVVVSFLAIDARAEKRSCTSRLRSPQRVTHVWVPKPGELKKKAAPAKAACTTTCVPQVQTTTAWQAVPTLVNVPQVNTVMTTQWQYQQRTQTVMQPVARTVVTPVSVPVQTYETRTGIQQVVRNVPVQVQRAVTTSCQCTQQVNGFAATVTASQPTTQLVTTVEHRPQIVNQQVSYQVPVTRYATQYQQRQILDYQAVQQTVNVPVAVQVPVQQVTSVPTVQYRYVPTQVPVIR